MCLRTCPRPPGVAPEPSIPTREGGLRAASRRRITPVCRPRPAVWHHRARPGYPRWARATARSRGQVRSRASVPLHSFGDRGATAKQPATYGTAGAHIATAVPCTCTSMSMCTRGTPPTPGDRRSRSAPRAALDTSGKQPAHHSAGLVNREAPARRVIGSERPERRKARRTRNRPSGEDAFSARGFKRADRAVHHRERNRMMARTKPIRRRPTAPANGAGTGYGSFPIPRPACSRSSGATTGAGSQGR